MPTDPGSHRVARELVRMGHVLVGGAALVLGGVTFLAGRAPQSELEGVLVGVGLLILVAATLFTWSSVVVLRRARDGRGGALSLTLSLVELVAGASLAVALAIAVRGYGAFEPWRSPLLLPATLLTALGIFGLALESRDRRPQAH